jgi:predicted dehydrogenase
MAEYLRLLKTGVISLDKIISKIYPIAQVSEAFQGLKTSTYKLLFVFLDYGQPDLKKLGIYKEHDRKILINKNTISKNVINIGLVGAGNFAKNVHIPNIHKLKNKFAIYAVMDQTGYKGKSIAQQNQAKYATTNYEDILNDKNIDLVFICTNHDSHADLTLKALEAGKHVFVEKPLATNKKDLDRIKNFYLETKGDKPLLMVGYNRRFSPYAQEVKRQTDKRINPLFIHYRMNAGYIPLDHWVHENGGRIVGEACHIIDLMNFFTDSQIKSISYESINPNTNHFSNSDNKSIILKYNDGSLCVIDYFALGSKKFSKEYLEVHFDGKTLLLDDYKFLKGFGVKINEIKTASSQKGHLEELNYLHDALTSQKAAWPIELWDLLQTTQATFLINQSL